MARLGGMGAYIYPAISLALLVAVALLAKGGPWLQRKADQLAHEIEQLRDS